MNADGDVIELLRASSRAETVAKAIEERIAAQSLPSGHRLGTKETLRQEFNVAAATLTEAVRLLSSRGTISVRPGAKGGIFVSSPPALVRLGRKMLELSGDSVPVSDALAMRHALEPLVTLEAMRHRSPADLEELHALVRQMTEVGSDMAAYLAINWSLHKRIAAITPNEILRHTYVSLLDFVESRLRRVTPAAESTSTLEGAEVHQRLVDAIGGGDQAVLDEVLAAHAALTADP
ncbi:FCD domain-containing protein [Streptomyces castrisilvae]|uniref:FCD domain-containing protein n=1 Tax=Streptomyces castrisilvae TaxID=3033811 RepID=A0ABY9HU23_9ACTN|nr:FCD domain-containing protein [Streptomyces sp. Mut1]WLQ37589.1 FCD domain-containing protein [Streptomyces sp. Mut1]